MDRSAITGSVRIALLNSLRVLCGPLRLCVEYCVFLLQYPILDAKAQRTAKHAKEIEHHPISSQISRRRAQHINPLAIPGYREGLNYARPISREEFCEARFGESKRLLTAAW